LQPENTNLGAGGNARPITIRTHTMKHDLIELTEGEFDKRYPLRTNHLTRFMASPSPSDLNQSRFNEDSRAVNSAPPANGPIGLTKMPSARRF
jgi:hypothetical protein